MRPDAATGARDPRAEALQQLPLRPFLRPPTFVPETTAVLDALPLLEQDAAHALIVVDQEGRPRGLVTTTDLIHFLRPGG